MRYIDPYQLADKVVESMRDNPHEGKLALNHRLEHEHFLRMIALAPNADVEPVVHARWKKTAYSGVSRCSCCDKPSSTPDCLDEFFDYCPNCGAKMDAGEFNE